MSAPANIRVPTIAAKSAATSGRSSVKTSITLSKDIVQAMDKLSAQYKNRSEFIELALRNYIAQLIRKERNARDLAIINQRADRLNKEALDVLAYQIG